MLTTSEYVTVTPNLAGSGESVSLIVTGQNNNNGSVTIDGQAASLAITGSVPINLSSPSGTTQTSPGHASQLKLSVVAHGVNALQSSGFSVAAIPVGLTEKYLGGALTSEGLLGIVVEEHWISDSGNLNDLDDVSAMEQVQIYAGSSTGIFIGKTIEDFDIQKTFYGITTHTTDEHAIPTSWITGSGFLALYQTHIFIDQRTGSVPLPIAHSGYLITHKSVPYKNIYEVTTTLEGLAVNANGYASTAGYIDANGQPIIIITEDS